MTNKSILGLTAATLPLASTDLFPVYQTTTTYKVTLASMQAAPVTAGIANSVQYLNGSKVPTTLSTFSFDGTNFGVGTASPSTYGQLAVIGTGAPTTFVGGNVNAAGVIVGGLKFGSTASSNAYINYGGQIASYTVGGIDQCDLRFFTSNGGPSTEVARFDHLKNLIFGTAAKGVNFTANTGAAGKTSNLLNWYEEGTFTATMTASTTPPTTPVTVSSTYTRIGRMVTVQIYFSNVNTTGAVGDLLITGLPFTVGSVRGSGVVGMSGFGTVSAFSVGVGTTLYIASNTTTAAIPIVAGPNKYFYTTISYQV